MKPVFPKAIVVVIWLSFLPFIATATEFSQGRDIFQQNCTPCHSVDRDAVPDMYGFNLTLYGIMGRKSADVDGFQYSEAMIKSGITWTPSLVELFIKDPFVVLPETRMIFFGLADSDERKILVEFLSSLK